jgi:hypothetical protein
MDMRTMLYITMNLIHIHLIYHVRVLSRRLRLEDGEARADVARVAEQDDRVLAVFDPRYRHLNPAAAGLKVLREED